MSEPLFWLGLSILLVAASLTAVLIAAIPALQELARAARSAEKLFDTLMRELPPTLDAIRTTSLEITDLKDDVTEGVKSAGQVVKQVDQSIDTAKKQAQNIQVGTRSFLIGVKTAWKTFTRKPTARRGVERLSGNAKPPVSMQKREKNKQENRRTSSDNYRSGEGYNENTSWDGDFDEKDLYPKSKTTD
ncbi:MAG: DUF948 domain-containing protein [Scytonematopsis contorta HA4267-MV1]|nr:DUF948 domain-containing protein [Scytonematopsis contorta HA4267-MV1]